MVQPCTVRRQWHTAHGRKEGPACALQHAVLCCNTLCCAATRCAVLQHVVLCVATRCAVLQHGALDGPVPVLQAIWSCVYNTNDVVDAAERLARDISA